MMSSRFSLDVARALLDKLANDDGFRADFVADPRAALRSLGHETPAADHGVPGRDPVLHVQKLQGGLASKEKIAADTPALLAVYSDPDTSKQALMPFAICT